MTVDYWSKAVDFWAEAVGFVPAWLDQRVSPLTFDVHGFTHGPEASVFFPTGAAEKGEGFTFRAKAVAH